MKAEANNILEIMSNENVQWTVPIYQRHYSWEKKQCRRLFEDLLTLSNSKDKKGGHFFGNVVYVSESSGGKHTHTLIDGQQRITTISLLLLAIQNYSRNEDVSINIKDEKIKTKYLLKNDKIRLELKKDDGILYKELVENGLSNSNKNSNDNIFRNYKFFYEEIKEMKNHEIEELYNSMNLLKVVFVTLELHEGDDPQLVFETLNSTGMSLLEDDKIRNYILMSVEQKNRDKFYEKYWLKIEKKISNKEMSKFIRYYLAIENRKLAPEKDIYFEFKKYYLEQENKNEELIAKIIIYANYYEKIRKSSLSDKGYTSVIACFKKLGVNTVIPLILDILFIQENYNISDDSIEKALMIIESYIFRRIVCKVSTKSLNEIFISIGQELRSKFDNSENSNLESILENIISNKKEAAYFPLEDEFKENFLKFKIYKKDKNIKQYFFERIENFKNKEKPISDLTWKSKNFTIEHVMPQNLNHEWKTDLGDNWANIHNEWLNTIGNLTLTAYNSEYQNSSFLVKKILKIKDLFLVSCI